MNKNIKLAVAGAVLALTASAANAGIIIPAGDWTVDIGGNVNMYTSWGKVRGTNLVDAGGLIKATAVNNGHTANGMGNGLLPNYLSVSGSTRQNDLDVSFTISLQPGSANNTALTTVYDNAANYNLGGLNNRQSFITFGDKSWGSVKVGKDLGIFASDAILSDITLLGVGGAAAGGGNTSLGRIGFGYIYADWKPQISYTTPNMNGFQATAGITQNFVGSSTTNAGTLTTGALNASPAYEGKASYSFAMNDVTGKVWVSGISQKQGPMGGTPMDDSVAYAGDIGANVNVAGFGLTGYYYSGNGIGTTGQMLNGYAVNSAGHAVARDTDGGYIQGTYILPTKTKVALSWGISNIDKTGTDLGTYADSNELWSAGVYHPLTKHLNLVAEYNYQRTENHNGASNHADVGSLGAILFF
jgi:predicted porin